MPTYGDLRQGITAPLENFVLALDKVFNSARGVRLDRVDLGLDVEVQGAMWIHTSDKFEQFIEGRQFRPWIGQGKS